MKIAGIDIGTTSICGIVLDTETGNVLKSVTKNSDAFIKSGYSYEKIQSVEKIINNAREVLEELFLEGIDAVGVTGQMHGIVYTDSDGNAISPLYTWQDQRGSEPYGDTTYADYMKSPSGYGAVTDFYNRTNGIRPKNAVSYCTIQDYLVMKLCSLKIPHIHETNYASFGKGVTKNMAMVTKGFDLAGSLRGIPVSVAIGDNQASVFSTLADENSILVNIGTGSQVSVISHTSVRGDDVETRPYFDGKVLIVGAALCGGRAYAILKDFYQKVLSFAGVTDTDVYEVMNEMLSCNACPLKVDTRFAGTRSDDSITGSVFGITEHNFTPEALTAGVIRGMTEELFDMYTAMNVKKCGLVGSGNGLRKNPYLVKTAEELFGFKMKIPRHVEEAAYGAALYAGIASGIFKDSAQAQKIVKYMD